MEGTTTGVYKMTTSRYDSVRAQLENSFQFEKNDWYHEATIRVIEECAKDGDSTANVIARLFN